MTGTITASGVKLRQGPGTNGYGWNAVLSAGTVVNVMGDKVPDVDGGSLGWWPCSWRTVSGFVREDLISVG